MLNITHLRRVDEGPPVRWMGRTERGEEIGIRFDWGAVCVVVDGRLEHSREVNGMTARECDDEHLRGYLANLADVLHLPAVIDGNEKGEGR